MYIIRIVKNPFFWIFLFFLFVPFLGNQYSDISNQRSFHLEFWDYFTSCYSYIFSILSDIGINPGGIYYDQRSYFSYLQIFVSVLGFTQSLALSLSFLNFPQKKSKFAVLLFILFLITLIPSIIVSILVAQ